jgi:hypothetical protein
MTKKSRAKRTVDERLMCHVRQLQYDFERKEGRLFMEAGHCCDCPACIDLFKSIDPEVSHIQTFSGRETDTRYVRDNEGNWAAFLPRGKA